MPKSSPYLQGSLVLDNGHLLVQVPKRSGILQRIAHKELGIISRTKCCWNSQKADVVVLSEIKAEVPLENDIPSHQNLPLQRYEERSELLSQENKVSKFCMDAGFIHVVEIGQYFMTEDTEEQFFARSCREYTLPRSDESSQPKGWIQGNTRIGPVLEITTSYLYGRTWNWNQNLASDTR